MQWSLLVGLLALAACGPQYLSPEERGWDDYQPFTADEALLRNAASVPDLRMLHRDVGLVCPDAVAPHTSAGCEVASVTSEGLDATGLSGVLSAWRFDADRLLTLDTGLQLALDDGRGGRTVLATGALDPRVAEDGRRVLFSQLEGSPDHFDLGQPATMVVLDTETGEVTPITDDPRDSSPWLVPHTDEVLFTSARTGLASLWLKAPGAPPRQLTNLEHTEVTADFVPVPSRELVFVAGTRKAVFSAHYGTHDLWSVDLDTGAALHLGPGRMPALDGAGGVLAVHDEDPALGLVVVRHAGGAL